MSAVFRGGEADTSPHPASEKCNKEEDKNQGEKALSEGGLNGRDVSDDGNESASGEYRGGMLSEAELERLGRERPAILRNWVVEIAFCFSVVMSQVLAVCLSPFVFFRNALVHVF